MIKFHFKHISPSLRLDDGNADYPEGYPDPFPVYWSVFSHAAGLVGTAKDAIKAFSFISQQPEFNRMTDYGLGIFRNNAGKGFICI